MVVVVALVVLVLLSKKAITKDCSKQTQGDEELKKQRLKKR